MPSPFPGMDPYLEAPDIWPDFHDSLAGHTRDTLNRSLPKAYFARLAAREEVSIIGEEETARIIPDVAIHHDREAAEVGGTATQVAPEVDTSLEMHLFLRAKTIFVEIVDAEQQDVVTVIEILSPWNKAGTGRVDFAKRRLEILDSRSSYVEIDLLRRGDRTCPPPLPQSVTDELSPRPEYVAVISRAWRRRDLFTVNVYPIYLRERLPYLFLPLREQTPDVRLDLQAVFDLAYEGGPYRRGAVRYNRPPAVPLDPQHEAWAAARVTN